MDGGADSVELASCEGGAGDGLPVLEAEEIFEQDLHREGQ
jgi:hypothetical protein